MDEKRSEQSSAARVGVRARGGSLAPGSVVGDGRYRLLAQFGIDERAGAHLWRARDGQLRRDVALTLLVGDPADAESARMARRTLERAAHAAKFTHDGVARVLDVLSLGSGVTSSEGLLGVVVTEWTKGTDLIDLVAEHPVAPLTAARMVQKLAEAVERAHHSGLVLGLDHPQRLRLTTDGTLRLAFPGPLPDATLRDDVKAIGAVLYLLLTGRWALPGGPAAIPAAPHAPNGRLVPPRSLQPAVPAELSSLAVRTIEDGGHGGIRTSAAILRALEMAAEAEEHTQLIKAQAAAGIKPEDDGTVWTTKKPVKDKARRRKLALGVTVLVVAAVAILAWLGMLAISFFQDNNAASGPAINVAQPTTTQAAASPPPPAQPSGPTGQVQLGAAVPAKSVTVYNPDGDGDNTSRAKYAVDGDPSTIWRTDQYRQQFPTIKHGVGLLATFAQPIKLARVMIAGASQGTVVEVRVADSADPDLPATRVVGTATLSSASTDVTLPQPQQGQYFIVWISQLSGSAGKYQSQIGELTFLPAQ
ncbi:protein kinase family protein [Amycolatopsis cynarae]|uniref:Protein kinase family protein n=1 Tax=Amycolatopsis cynarae TaxID=2995223 RepID=A0ABY7B0A7_9PSEU|nr:protein kinase family protein [Amycolatopsis sp. HUAS 11-8]WAL65631.1 protein kinase family protein [Amycolatopsis sp. HUAS 11-8]